MPPIDVAYAWSLLRDARRREPDASWQPCKGLTLLPGGGWHATRALTPEAAALFDLLLPIAYGAPACVIAQIGQSLDGRIATPNGHAQYITGLPGRTHLHRLRALVDAVVVGANTAILDDPQLTVRHVEGDSPVRVILDPNGRVPATRRVFTDGGPPTWHLVGASRQAAAGAVALRLTDEGVNVPRYLLAKLAEKGLRRVLIEGGGYTISRFIEAGCIDRMHVMVAPLLIGSGRPAIALPEIHSLNDAIRPAFRSYGLGDDRLYDLDLRGSPRTS